MTILNEYREMQQLMNAYDLMKKTLSDINDIVELNSEITEQQARHAIKLITQKLDKFYEVTRNVYI